MRHEPRITALTGAKLDEEVWHFVEVLGGQEEQKSNRLAAGGIHCAYPKKQVISHRNGVRIETERADVPRYIATKFKFEPNWAAMRMRGIITGVVCKPTEFGPVPYRATQNDIRRWMGIPTVEEELEAERLAALKVHPGDRARVLVGRDLVLAVMVTDVRNGRVYWEAGGMKGDTVESRAEKVA